MARRDHTGVSLAKGPVGLVGLLLLAYGVLALIFGGNGFTANPVDGTVQGTKWLGLEANGWSNALTAGAGALLLLGAPLHWGAKSLALIIGLALGAASVIALIDGDDVFGIFAANGPMTLAWGIAAAILLILALLPRIGRHRNQPAHGDHHDSRFERDRSSVARDDRSGSVAARRSRDR